MTPSERLTEARVQLSAAHAHLDHLAGELPDLERDAAITLRAELGEIIRKAKNLQAFMGPRVS